MKKKKSILQLSIATSALTQGGWGRLDPIPALCGQRQCGQVASVSSQGNKDTTIRTGTYGQLTHVRDGQRGRREPTQSEVEHGHNSSQMVEPATCLPWGNPADHSRNQRVSSASIYGSSLYRHALDRDANAHACVVSGLLLTAVYEVAIASLLSSCSAFNRNKLIRGPRWHRHKRA